MTKVKNLDGPQLKFMTPSPWIPFVGEARPHSYDHEVPRPLTERLNLLESQLKVKSEPYMDIHARLRDLEDRLLALEGSSPEYSSVKQSPTDDLVLQRNNSKNSSLQEIDDRVRHLKQILLTKKRRLDPGALLS